MGHALTNLPWTDDGATKSLNQESSVSWINVLQLLGQLTEIKPFYTNGLRGRSPWNSLADAELKSDLLTLKLMACAVALWGVHELEKSQEAYFKKNICFKHVENGQECVINCTNNSAKNAAKVYYEKPPQDPVETKKTKHQ